MKVLIDTNVLVDYFAHRSEYYEDAKKIVLYCISNIDGCIAAHSIPNINYILKNVHKFENEKCKETIDKMLNVFEIADINVKILNSANNDSTFPDFEDSIQNQCAISSEVNCIITRNTKDFLGTPKNIAVLQPKQFLEELEA